MAIPLLAYAPTTQNSRVQGFDVANDDQPRVFSTDNLLSTTDMDVLIEAAYRQIYFHAFAADREPFLESQLRNGQITVREFIRGLCLSDTFTRSFYNLAVTTSLLSTVSTRFWVVLLTVRRKKLLGLSSLRPRGVLA